MKAKSFLLLLVILFTAVSTFSGPLRFVKQTLVQPNGDTLKCFASGDEFYHWLHDKDGYTITFNPKTKYWVYADKKGDDLIPTNLVAGKSNPVKAKLIKWLLPNWNSIKNNYTRKPKSITR